MTSSDNEISPVNDEDSSVNATTSESESTVTSDTENLIEIKIQQYEVDVDNGLHVIHPTDAMDPGAYSLEIDYEILPDGKTVYSASFNNSDDAK